MNRRTRKLAFWLGIPVALLALSGALLAGVVLWQVVQSSAWPAATEYNFAAFQQEVISDNVDSVKITNGIEVEGKLKSGQNFTAVLPTAYPGMIELLEQHGVTMDFDNPTSPAWLSALVSFAPIVLMLAFWALGLLLAMGMLMLAGALLIRPRLEAR